jgi:hypothetical protein
MLHEIKSFVRFVFQLIIWFNPNPNKIEAMRNKNYLFIRIIPHNPVKSAHSKAIFFYSIITAVSDLKTLKILVL